MDQTDGRRTAVSLLREVEQFLFREARLLDENRFEDWLSLFTDDAHYWVPSQRGQENPVETVSIIYDDRRLLETRVRRLSGNEMHAGTPLPETSRLIGNVICTEAAGDKTVIETECRFQMAEYRLGKNRQFAGTMHHKLLHTDQGFMIASKRVDLVNCEDALEGITVPF